MENYLLAAALATVAPGLLLKGCSMILQGTYTLGHRAVYGKQKTEQEITLEEVKELKRKFEEKLEKKLEEINDREMRIDLKLEELLKVNYYPPKQ
jgi:hypothetical protein